MMDHLGNLERNIPKEDCGLCARRRQVKELSRVEARNSKSREHVQPRESNPGARRFFHFLPGASRDIRRLLSSCDPVLPLPKERYDWGVRAAESVGL